MRLEPPATAGPGTPRGVPRVVWVWAAAITLATLACYGQVAHQEFCSFDDHQYVVDNPIVRQGLTPGGVRWAFTTLYAANYFPMTWLSLMLDSTLWGVDALNAGPQKLTNVAFHIASTWVLLATLVRATGSVWRSVAVASLFALHPLHVESVAWMTERKDVLSVFFGFTAIWAYVRYVSASGATRWRWYAVVMLAAVLSLLSKPMFVTLPFVLLLLDVWPLRRWVLPGGVAVNEQPAGAGVPRWRLLLEKLPLLALSFASAAMTVVAQHVGGAVQSVEAVPVADRLANAVIAYAIYLRKTAWPSDLCYYYELAPWTAGRLAGSAAVLAAITCLVVFYARRKPWLGVGWLFFLGTLVPVIGVVQVGGQAMADRYMYLPLVGVFVACAWSVPDDLLASPVRRWGLGLAGGAVLVVLAVVTHSQVATWRNDDAMYARARQVEPDSRFNLTNYSAHLIATGKPEQAIAVADRLIALHPRLGRGYVNRGAALVALGRDDEALKCFEAGLRAAPSSPQLHSEFARLLQKHNEPDKAIEHLRIAFRDDPAGSGYARELGEALAGRGRFEEAAAAYREGLTRDPADTVLLNNLGVTLDRMNQPAQAIAVLEHGRTLLPRDAAIRENLAAVYAHAGRFADAAAQYEWLVLQPLQPVQAADANHRLAIILAANGEPARAIACLRKAASLTPMDAEVRNDLGVALAKQGDLAGAAAEFAAALKADPNHTDARANLSRIQGMMNRR